MKVILQRIWSEPAVAIGLVVSAALLIAFLLNDGSLSTESIIAIIAPLASALGIRQLVSPAAGPRTPEPPAQ